MNEIDKTVDELIKKKNIPLAERDRAEHFIEGTFAGKSRYELFNGEEITLYLALNPSEILKYILWVIWRVMRSTRDIVRLYIRNKHSR